MQTSSALCVYALILASAAYSQPGRRTAIPQDDLGLHGVIPNAPGGEQSVSHANSQAVVSVAELRHKPAAKARREWGAARKACARQELMVCVEHLKKSLEIDPEFLEARQDLGRVYVSLDQPENVIEAYQSVLKMDARSADAYTFIGAAQASLEHYGDAEAAARQALRIVPNHPRGRFVLGLSLAAQKKNDSEALRCLVDSSEAYPGAHMFAAQVLARRGQTAEARRHLETYLPVAPPSERATVENWLSRLEQRSSVASH